MLLSIDFTSFYYIVTCKTVIENLFVYTLGTKPIKIPMYEIISYTGSYIDNIVLPKIYPFNIFVCREELNLQKSFLSTTSKHRERENKFSASRGLHKKL